MSTHDPDVNLTDFTKDLNEKSREIRVTGINSLFDIPEDMEFDFETNTNASVEYSITPYYKKWGIDSISILVKRVVANVEWEVSIDELSDREKAYLIHNGGTESLSTIEGTIHIDSSIPNEVSLNLQILKVKFLKTDWQVIDERAFADDGGFTFDELTIDFTNFTLTLE